MLVLEEEEEEEEEAKVFDRVPPPHHFPLRYFTLKRCMREIAGLLYIHTLVGWLRGVARLWMI